MPDPGLDDCVLTGPPDPAPPPPPAASPGEPAKPGLPCGGLVDGLFPGAPFPVPKSPPPPPDPPGFTG